MKKLFTVLICAIMVLGIGGCSSSKELSNEDLYARLKDDENKFKLVFRSDDNQNKIYQLQIYNKDQAITYIENPVDEKYVNLLIVKSGYKEGFERIKTDGKSKDFISNGKCFLEYSSKSEASTDVNSTCSETEIIDYKETANEFENYFKELNITPNSLENFGKWYIEQNKKDATADKEDVQTVLYSLGFKKVKDGVYLLSATTMVGDTQAIKISVDTHNKTFSFMETEDIDSLVQIHYEKNAISFKDKGNIYHYDFINKKWIGNEGNIENEILALHFSNDYYNYCNENELYLK